MTRLQKKMILLLWMMTSLHLFLIFWNFQVLLCTHAIYVLIRQVDPGFLDLPWFSSLAWSLEPRKLHSYFWVLDLGVGCFTQYLHFSLSVHHHWRLRRRHLAQKLPPTSRHEINCVASSFLLNFLVMLLCHVQIPNVGFPKKSFGFVVYFWMYLRRKYLQLKLSWGMWWHRWLYRW